MDFSMRNKRVALLGLGRSSVAAARLVQLHGAVPFVSDNNDNDKLKPYRKTLEQFGIAYEVGGHTNKAFQNPDMVVLSPGVPANLPILAPLRQVNVPIIGELELASRFYTGCILAVTGTNGKTTTTRLLHHMLQSCGHSVMLAGNNETPFSEVVCMEKHPDYVVLEVSSYQLESTDCFHPHIAAVLNLTPDHLGRHGSMETYAQVKARIFAHQQQGDRLVLNYDDAVVKNMLAFDRHVPNEESIDSNRYLEHSKHPVIHYFSLKEPVPCGLWVDGDTILDETGATVAQCSDFTLPGNHNLSNALAALTMMRAGSFSWEATLQGMRSFLAVEHRIEPVASIDGVQFYNDSKSTNIDSLRVALESFDKPLTLIAGGQGKGSDYTVLRPLIQDKVTCLVTLGEDAPKFEAAFGDIVPFKRATSMQDAVEQAFSSTPTGGVVLLSPGCASFDMYDNFESRGDDFKELVHNLVKHCSISAEEMLGT